MKRRYLLLALLAAAAAPAPAATGPEAPVAQLDAALLAAMRLGPAGFAARAALLRPVIEQAFDLRQILQVSVGPRFAALPADQQATLLDVFIRYTVASYAANFDGFDGQRFDILPQTRAVGADRVVATQIVPRSGDATRIDYQVREGTAGWRIVDILFDGSISRVAVQRSDFRALLRGGSAAPLIDSLRRKVASLEAGGKS